jgi:DNA polymerase-3 subunit delta
MANIIGNPRANAAALGVQDWVFEKIRKSTAGWTEDSIARVIHQLADTDFAVKGGEGDANYALERLVSLVANKGKN